MAQQKSHSVVKLLYQVLQCLHHLAQLPNGAGKAAPAFERKAKELGRFIRPAIPGDKYVQKKIKETNEKWAQEQTKNLINHYTHQIDEVRGQLWAANISKNDLNQSKGIAMSWAHRNFGKKLAKQTISKFSQIVDQISAMTRVPPTPTTDTGSISSVRSGVKSRVADPRASTSGGSVTKTNIPSRSMQTSTPQKRRRQSSPESSPTQSQTAKKSCTSPKLSTFGPATYVDATKSPSAKKANSKPQPKAQLVNRFPQLKGDQRGSKIHSVWEIPKVVKDTLIIGTGNLGKITSHSRRPDVQIVSYMGIKLDQLLKLLQGFKHGPKSAAPGLKPKNVVIEIGFNDRSLSESSTETSLKKVVNEAKRMFPGSLISLVNTGYSSHLPLDEKQKIQKHNNNQKSLAENRENMKFIPPLPGHKFKTEKDNLTWSENCANATIEHIFQHLN